MFMNLKAGLKIFLIIFIFLLILFSIYIYLNLEKMGKVDQQISGETKIFLPKEFIKGELLVFDSIKTRRSLRDYAKEPLSLRELSTLLFATQGITSGYKRAAPSAGALYPIETYLAVNNVEGLAKGLYHYLPQEHSLVIVKPGDFSREIRKYCLDQDPLENAAVNFIWSAVFERTTKKYEERGLRYIFMEAGHISQNLYLQANSMGLGVVAIGAFDDEKINQLLDIDSEKESVIYINSVGKK